MAVVNALKKNQCAIPLADLNINEMSLTFDWNADKTAVVLSLGFVLDPAGIITAEGELPDGSFGVFNLSHDQCLAVVIPTLTLAADNNNYISLSSDDFRMATGGDKGEHGNPAKDLLARFTRADGLVNGGNGGGNGGGGGVKGEHGVGSIPPIFVSARARFATGGGGEGDKGEHGKPKVAEQA